MRPVTSSQKIAVIPPIIQTAIMLLINILHYPSLHKNITAPRNIVKWLHTKTIIAKKTR